MATTVVILPMTSVVVLVKRWGGRSDGRWGRDGGHGAISGVEVVNACENFMTGYRIVFDREKMVLGWESSNCYDAEKSSTLPVNPPEPSAIPPTSTVEPEATSGGGNGSPIPSPGPPSSASDFLHLTGTSEKKKNKILKPVEKSSQSRKGNSRSKLLLKLNYEGVLNAWSDRGTPFSKEVTGHENSGIDLNARLGQIDLFSEIDRLRETSELRYKKKATHRLLLK
ncbi:hypothetical protein RHGRI_003161 [Rhododendron griersonianum]|uniref:Uncharacterized protein n=1 Tax=Rhododendron griersonianum TaxID=479676 RepID=A0AAV6L597_9ERIC|nr:hypothetical protein RHGRI_003161 [Rhododendron griersonianum]